MADIELIDTKLGRLWNGLPPKIAFCGDSIAYQTATLSLRSPWFWAQVAQPRLYTFCNKAWDGTPNGAHNLAISGSWSGAVTGHAANTAFDPNTSKPDMNTAAVKTALIALDPDILFIQVGTNDASAAYAETFANVKAVVDAVNPRHAILWSVLPRNGAGNASYRHANAMYRRWERIDPRIHFLDSYPTFLDDTAASNGPIGGTGGDAGDVTNDGLHPGVVGARAAAADLNRILDRIGVPKANFIATGQASGYDGATQPYGNMLDTKGAFGGTGGSKGSANATGNLASGWALDTDSSELTVAASKSTMVVDGVTFTAQQLDFTVASTLTAARNCQLNLGFGGFVTPGAMKALVSTLVQIINLKDCLGIEVKLSGATPYQASMGSVPNYSTAPADCIPNGVTETLKYLYPGHGETSAAGAVNIVFIITFRQGATAEAKGSIKIAQCGAWPVPDTV